MGSLAIHETKGVMPMKVWGVPVNFPNPEKEPEQADAAMKFLQRMKGIKGFCPHESGNMVIVFERLEDARAAKWKLEEFAPVPLSIIEGTITKDGKKLNCNRVLKD